MERIWTTCLALLLILGFFVGDSRSQNLIVDQQKQQQQIERLRSDVDELKRTVESLRKVILRKSIAADKAPKETTTAPATPPAQTLTPAEQERIKVEVCQSLGQFFDQIDKALNMPNASDAGRLMRKAIAELNAETEKYGRTEKIRDIMSLAEGLAWDTYVAVQNRNSVAGNSDFINYINDYKTKYKKRCLNQ